MSKFGMVHDVMAQCITPDGLNYTVTTLRLRELRSRVQGYSSHLLQLRDKNNGRAWDEIVGMLHGSATATESANHD